MEEIQKSELVISKILALLMEWGIQECNLEFSELELDNEFAPFFFPCIDWLAAEGVIRFHDIHRTIDGVASGLVRRPVLTSYGMRILGTQMKLGTDETKALSEAVRDVNSGNAQYAKAGNFTGGLLAAFIKSLG